MKSDLNANNQHDRNFDDIAQKFNAHIYGTTKGKIREAILWDELSRLLVTLPQNLTILDAGGGQGQIALKLAELGHQVTLVDHSQEMLLMAEQEAKARSLHLQFKESTIQELPESWNQQFDLVLCHAVLEWVAEPEELIQRLKNLLKPDGYLSLMFYNRDALLFKMVTLGNFGYIGTGLSKRKKKTLSPDYPCDPQTVYRIIHDLDLEIINKTGIRVFHDYLIQKEKQKNCFDELLALERQYCQQEPFLSLARYLHLLIKKR